MCLLILGLGNDLLGDDRIGLLAAWALEERSLNNVRVATSSLSGLYLLDLVEGYDDLIVIDSVIGDRPGNVVKLQPVDVVPRQVPSAHYVGLVEALNVARRAGMKMPKRVAIIAMQIHSSQVMGSNVSPKVLDGLPKIIEEVLKLARLWGYDVESSLHGKQVNEVTDCTSSH